VLSAGTGTAVIERFEAVCAASLGDGLLGSYFGYPVAHEDDAQRAVAKAGWRLSRALAKTSSLSPCGSVFFFHPLPLGEGQHEQRECR